MNVLAFIDSVLGVIPAEFQFFKYALASIIVVVFCAVVLNLFLGTISTLTNKFFK